MGFWKKNKLLFSLVIAVFWIAVFALLIWTDVMGIWQLRLSNYLYGVSGAPSEKIVIVGIDDKTLDPVNGLGDSATWSRSVYAKALQNLKKYQPKVVAFDIFFTKEKDLDGDTAFQNELAGLKNVILAMRNITDSGQAKDTILPISLFRDLEAVNLADANNIKDQDEIIRHYKISEYDQNTDKMYDSFAAKSAQLFLEKNDVSDLNIPAEKGKMLINIFSDNFENKYQRIPLLDLYNDKYSLFNPENFRNKIVLIGAFSQTLNDSFFTPDSMQTKKYGVEIHANAIQTILEGKFLRNLTPAEKTGLIVVLCLAAGLIFMMTKIRWSVSFLIGVPAVYTALAPFAFSRGIILDLAHPYLAIAAVFVSIYLYRYVTEFKEKMVLKSAFSKYVNPKIVEKIMASPEQLKLGGDKKEVTVLFTDIEHFTSVSEKMKPESLVAFLNSYLDAMSRVIMDDGGTVDKYEGDAIMAFFGAPLTQEDHAARACRTALKMRRALVQLQEKWAKSAPLPGGESWPAIDFRCGINSGEVIVGNVGSADRFNYTIIGDSVNLGSRLEGANKDYGTKIMVSGNTYQIVKDNFIMRELDVIRVVGKKEPIRVYELLAEKTAESGSGGELLEKYNQGISLYYGREFGKALALFNEILKVFPDDGPAKVYRQRCEVLRDFPPANDWDWVFEKRNK